MKIVNRTSLSNQEYQQVVYLMKLCEEQDKLALSASINLSMLKKADEGQMELLLTYEESDLVGFLGIYSFIDKRKVEIAGMIHPAYRNRGKFNRLLEEAWQICNINKVSEILLVCPAKSQTAKNLMRKLKANYSFSEYTMEYQALKKKEGLAPFQLELKRAEVEDIEIVTKLLRDGFDFEEADGSLHSLLKRNLTKEGFELCVIKELNQCIGTLTISDEESSIYISAFTITSKKRGRGIGKEVLKLAIKRIENNYPHKKIRLDVDVKNSNALKLYEGVGFQKLSGYDYYSISVKK